MARAAAPVIAAPLLEVLTKLAAQSLRVQAKTMALAALTPGMSGGGSGACGSTCQRQEAFGVWEMYLSYVTEVQFTISEVQKQFQPQII